MKKQVIEIFGILVFLVGFIFMTLNLTSMTGYSVINFTNLKSDSFFSIVCVVGGLTLFIAGRHIKTSEKIAVKPERGAKKIRLTLATKAINYGKLKRLAKETGYRVVETNEYTTIFSPRDKVIRDENDFPIVIKESHKNNKEVLLKMLQGILEDYNSTK